MLEKSGLSFVKQFKIKEKYFDAFLPEYNILLEFDGDFYHQDNLSKCKYDIQTKNFRNDIYKNKLAKRFGYKLVRIKESMVKNITDIKTFVLQG